MHRDDFLAAVAGNPVNPVIIDALFQLNLPDAWMVAGCLVQSVWNELTGRDAGYGIADYDVFYFDPDTSWQAEDDVIRTVRDRTAALGVRIEARNQARVHLWYPQKHGVPYPPLRSSCEGIDRFLTRNTQVGVRRRVNGYDVYAPNGFGDIAGMIVRPNPGLNFSASEYNAKAARWKNRWPEITVIAADDVRQPETPTA